MKIENYIKKRKLIIDKELNKLLFEFKEIPQIYQPIKYALKGGKRLRPILCIASAELVGGNIRSVLKAACAIEMIHTYSLIYDDLPFMDNDDYRRGRLSCHKKFGISSALLAGDLLLVFGFYLLSSATPKPQKNCRIVREVASACGIKGMIGGQILDLNVKKSSSLLKTINTYKTASLIAVSCKIGGIIAGAKEKEIRSLSNFGKYFGLLFQFVDDILDGEIEKEKIFPTIKILAQKAKRSLSSFKKNTEIFYTLIDKTLSRINL